MEQHLVTPGAEHIQCGDHAAQNAVLVANVLFGQTGNAVMYLLPADDGIEIRVGGGEVTEGRMLGTLHHFLLNGGHHGEIHVGNPHGDDVEALSGSGIRPAGSAHSVDGDGVLPTSVQDGCKIVFHGDSPLSDDRSIIEFLGENSNTEIDESVEVGVWS